MAWQPDAAPAATPPVGFGARLRERWGAMIAQSQRWGARATQLNRPRLIWAAGAMLLLNLGHVGVFQARSAAGEARVTQWASGIAWAHGAMVGVMLLLLVLLGLTGMRRRLPVPAVDAVPGDPVARGATIVFGGATLAFAVALAVIDQAVTPNVTPFLLAALVIGMLLLQPPAQSLPLYLLAGTGFWLAMGQGQPDAALRLSNQVNGVSACVTGWILSLLFWRHFVQHEGLLAELRSREALLQAQQQRLQELAVRDGLTQNV
jgi:hypothetical protein